MANESIIIIGAGIAGLSAGCYSQMNGYRTRIFEMGTNPGGLCTSWKRKGYTIDGCIHWLVGSSPGNNFYRIWEELGAVQGRHMVNHDEYLRVEGDDDKVFIVYSDINRLEQHMKELAPEDKDVIEEFIKALHRTADFDVPLEWAGISLQDFAQRFTNPFLREALGEALLMAFGYNPDLPMLGILMTLAFLHLRMAGYPLGGSLEFAQAIERRYLDLGGEIYYKSPVTKIMVENDRAVGVRLADGTEYRSDIIISAADGRTTIFDMLDGKYISDEIRGYYDQLSVLSPLIFISLGVARSFEEIPPSVAGLYYLLDEPVTISGREWRWLPVHIYNFDPSLAPAGRTLVTVMLASDYEYWKKLKQGPERYKAEKEQIADKVIALLDRRFPGFAAQVEMRDVATPMTFERFTGNWQGSYMGWLMTPKTLGIQIGTTLPGLENFYMAGQWVRVGGGLPPAAMSGRDVTQIICERDNRPFIAMVP